ARARRGGRGTLPGSRSKLVGDADVDVEVEGEVPEAEDGVGLADQRQVVGQVVEDPAAGAGQNGAALDGVDAGLVHHRPTPGRRTRRLQRHHVPDVATAGRQREERAEAGVVVAKL